MRVFAISDIHVDYESNAQWVRGLSRSDYAADVLLLGGDVSDSESALQQCFGELVRRFKIVLFVPGNHELWVIRDGVRRTSLEKFERVRQIALDNGVVLDRCTIENVELVPLLAWYDYSFAQPGEDLLQIWMDYRACVWPHSWDAAAVTRHFLALNPPVLPRAASTVISFSHFLPRIDLMPEYIPASMRVLYPVLGTALLDEQIRGLGAQIHVFGHSHVNRRMQIDGVEYVNNAFGYPSESNIAGRRLVTVFEN